MSEESALMLCRACGRDGESRLFSAREMLFGLRHRFEYGECPHCGSLGIRTIPANLADYYPANYISLHPPLVRKKTPRPGGEAAANWLLRSRSGAAGWLARRLRWKYPFFHWCRLAGAGLESRILDVGSGAGGLLRRMQRHGFKDLTGIDPYTSIVADEPGFRVQRAVLADMEGAYDLIMLHHVLEHLVDPRQSLKEARARLNPRGRILVRIPVAGSHTWRIYRENWYNLDPPRHLLVPSRRGMEVLAERSGLRPVHVDFDGIDTGYLISEHYRRDTPFMAKPEDSPARRRHYRRLAEKDNRSGDGDQGVFFLAVA